MNEDLLALLTPVSRLSKDVMDALRKGSSGEGVGGITKDEARFLVDLYYSMQKTRIVINNQTKGLDRDAKKAGNEAEPHDVLDWTLTQFKALEGEVAKALNIYVNLHPMLWFFERTLGVGPIISAGLLAHIDITKAPTVGHIWNFAGLNPDGYWCGRDEAKKLWKEAIGASPVEKLTSVAAQIGRNPDSLIYIATHKPDGTEVDLTEANALSAISKKPFNGQLKTLCWKIGDSFVKLSNRPDSFYGGVYRKRKLQEWERNLSGELSDQARKSMEQKKYGKTTDAFAWYSGLCSPALTRSKLAEGKPLVVKECKGPGGIPMLSPGHIDARARRYTVKLFLSHLHECWYRSEFGKEPPKPFAISQLGHAHYIEPPQRRDLEKAA